jgi:hypothetical protein
VPGPDKTTEAQAVHNALTDQRLKTVEEKLPGFALKTDVEFLKSIVFKGAGTIITLVLVALLSGKFLR